MVAAEGGMVKELKNGKGQMKRLIHQMQIITCLSKVTEALDALLGAGCYNLW